MGLAVGLAGWLGGWMGGGRECAGAEGRKNEIGREKRAGRKLQRVAERLNQQVAVDKKSL